MNEPTNDLDVAIANPQPAKRLALNPETDTTQGIGFLRPSLSI